MTSRLSDLLVRIEAGKSFGAAARPAGEGEWAIVKVSAMTWGAFKPDENKVVNDVSRIDPRHEIRSGDVLVSRANTTEYVGAPVLVRHTRPRLLLSDKSLRLVPQPGVDPAYLHAILSAPQTRKRISALATGTKDSMRNISQSALLQVEVPTLPPVEEQRRIVDLLEDHLSRLDAADAYIKSSRRRLLALERGVLAELHHGPAMRLGSLAWNSGYGTSEKCVVDGPGVPVVRIPNLVDGSIDLADEKRVADAAADVSGSMLSAGDLLIVRTNGSVDLIGRSAVVQDGIDAAYASYLIRYRLDVDRVRPNWVRAMLSAPQVRRKIEPLAASSAGQHNLSLAKLNPLELPVPSLAEQDDGLARIAAVREISGRMSVELDLAERRSRALRRAVLAAAFSGRLTRSADLSDTQDMIPA